MIRKWLDRLDARQGMIEEDVFTACVVGKNGVELSGIKVLLTSGSV